MLVLSEFFIHGNLSLFRYKENFTVTCVGKQPTKMLFKGKLKVKAKILMKVKVINN